MEKIKFVRDKEDKQVTILFGPYIYEVPALRSITIAGSITTSSLCSAVFTPPLPGESQHKDPSSLDLNNTGDRFTFLAGYSRDSGKNFVV